VDLVAAQRLEAPKPRLVLVNTSGGKLNDPEVLTGHQAFLTEEALSELPRPRFGRFVTSSAVQRRSTSARRRVTVSAEGAGRQLAAVAVSAWPSQATMRPPKMQSSFSVR
jgi:hypothetical protein